MAASPTCPVPKASRRRARIMVVDDAPENLRLLETILRGRGFHTQAFPLGRLALAAVASSVPDLILLDVNMPEMDGYEVCRQLKADPSLAAVPVIFISAMVETLDKVKAFDCGGADYVTKPFQPDEVLARVGTHLRFKEAREGLARSYERLRELEAMRDSLMHMIVHDLRSPLMVIGGYLDLIAKRLKGFPEAGAQPLMANARLGLGQLQEMISSILDVKRIEEGRMPVKPVRHDLTEFARECLEEFAPLMKGHLVEFKKPRGKVVVWADPGLVRRVIGNLVGNALKFTPRDGAIRLRVEKRGEAGRFEVQDSGPGVDPEALAGLFEKFRQSEVHRTRHSSGLGLAFCKLAVETQGGRIGASSVERQGTTFWFELPTAPAAEPAARPASRGPNAPALGVRRAVRELKSQD